MSKFGLDLGAIRVIAPNINELREAFHKHELRVCLTQLAFASDYADSGLLIEGVLSLKDLAALTRVSWNADFSGTFMPRIGERVVVKTRHNAFLSTDLEQQSG